MDVEASKASDDSVDYDFKFKVIQLGDSNVGKTALSKRFANDKFCENQATVGVEYSHRVVTIGSDKIKAVVIDTAGMEQYRSMTRSYYRQAHGVLLVYSIDNMESFNNLESWMDELKANAPNVVIRLIGNKCDLQSARVVSKQQGLTFASKHAISFYETSAKESIDVDVAFINLLTEIYNRKKVPKISEATGNTTPDTGNTGTSDTGTIKIGSTGTSDTGSSGGCPC